MENDVLAGLDEVIEAPDAPEPKVDADAGKEPVDAKGKEPAKGEAGKEPAKEPEKAKEEPKTIPLAAHLEERARHKQELEQLRRDHAAIRAELEGLKKPKDAPPAEPVFNAADPKPYVDQKVGAVLKQLETGTAELKKTAEEARSEAGFARFQQTLQSTEQQFLAQNPDYYDALTHLRTIRIQELSTLHPDATQEQIMSAMHREELQLAHQLMSVGRNPHQVAYQLAKSRGYARKEASGAAAVLPEVPKQKQLPPDQTLGTGSGAPNAGETFLDDDEVFDKAFSEVFGRKRA
jgi:hypothetical protein